MFANGHGGDDGEIQVGYRWKYQKVGALGAGDDTDWPGQGAIGICLVGYQAGLTTLDARGTSAVRLAAEMSFGVLGLNGDDSEFELLALAVEEVPR